MICTVPMICPAAFCATIRIRSRCSTPAATPRQNATAVVRAMGNMKLTEAPPSTQSMSTSLNS
jgi:hypothetical protein